MSASRVEVYFTDRDGVKWQLYEFGLQAGRRMRYPIGTVTGVYRGFVRVDNPSVRRAVLLVKKAEVEAARRLSPHELQAELDRSDDWSGRGRGPTD